MQTIIPTQLGHVNSNSYYSHPVSQIIYDDHGYPIKNTPKKRFHLTRKQLMSSHEQRREWVKNKSIEHKLNRTQVLVLEALAFLTNPETGEGVPALGTIQERVSTRYADIHYTTVQRCLVKLAKLGIIQCIRRGYKLTNLYILIGYEFKLESISSQLLNNPSRPSAKSREGHTRKRKYINPPGDTLVGVAGSHEKDRIESQKRIAETNEMLNKPEEELPSRETVSSYLANLKNILNQPKKEA